MVVTEMLYPRLAAPDLGETEEFVTAFGMASSTAGTATEGGPS